MSTVGILRKALELFPDDMPVGLSVFRHMSWSRKTPAAASERLHLSRVRMHHGSGETTDVALLRIGDISSTNGYRPEERGLVLQLLHDDDRAETPVRALRMAPEGMGEDVKQGDESDAIDRLYLQAINEMRARFGHPALTLQDVFPSRRTTPGSLPEEPLPLSLVGAETIAAELQSWLDWNEKGFREDGATGPISDGVHIVAPPVWPSRGTIKAWIAYVRRLAGAVAAARAAQEGRIGVVCVSGQEEYVRQLWPTARCISPGQSAMGMRYDLVIVICEGRIATTAVDAREFSAWLDEQIATKLSREGRLIRLG